MKEIVHYADGSSAIVTVPTCDTCFEKTEQLEAVQNLCSARVAACKKGRTPAYPAPCNIYVKNIRTRIWEFVEHF
jgi:hypothetical protein